jgi:arylsulfatase A-like enzyme
MPNISALKNSGVLFSKAYAQPVCSPTRACILTGRHPFRTSIGAQLEGATSPQLQASEFTLPEAFAANSALGYSLAMFGKWHLNAGAGTNDTPRTIGGWPHFAGTIIGALPDYSAWTKITNGVSVATTNYATTDAINDTIAWIAGQGSSPWFAWVALNAPHSPLHQPPLDLHSYDSATATNRNLYEAMCEAMDTEVGRLLAGVNLTETTVIFIGDNGTPSTVIQTPYSAAHSKGTLYDGGVRVPLIIAGKGVVSPNRTSTQPVHCVDLYSTILELAGINVSATQPAGNPIDSVSLLPILQNSTAASRYLFVEQFSADLATNVSGQAVIDEAGYKLIQFDDGHEEFYKTSTDTNEATTLLGNVGITSTEASASGGHGHQHSRHTADLLMVHSGHWRVCPHLPDSRGSEQRHDGHDLEPWYRHTSDANLCRSTPDRLLGDLGVHPHHRPRQSHHGAVVSECGEDEPLPELPVQHSQDLSLPTHTDDPWHQERHRPRRYRPHGEWRVDV